MTRHPDAVPLEDARLTQQRPHLARAASHVVRAPLRRTGGLDQHPTRTDLPRPAPPSEDGGLPRFHRSDGVRTELTRVLLCEDHEVYRIGLRVLLEAEPDLQVVGEADDVRSATALAGRLGAGVVVVRQGLLLGSDDGLLEELCRRDAAVLVLSESDSEPELVRALRAGARGYLSRRLGGRRLVDGIRSLARDEAALDPAVARHLVRYLTDGSGTEVSAGRTALDQLTERQRAVALLVAEGLTNEEIASRLFVSQATVKSHLTAVLRRLDIRSRTQLAILVNRGAALLP